VGETLSGGSQALYTLCSSALQKWVMHSDAGKVRCNANVWLTAKVTDFALLKIVEFKLYSMVM